MLFFTFFKTREGALPLAWRGFIKKIKAFQNETPFFYNHAKGNALGCFLVRRRLSVLFVLSCRRLTQNPARASRVFAAPKGYSNPKYSYSDAPARRVSFLWRGYFAPAKSAPLCLREKFGIIKKD